MKVSCLCFKNCVSDVVLEFTAMFGGCSVEWLPMENTYRISTTEPFDPEAYRRDYELFKALAREYVSPWPYDKDPIMEED